MTTSRSKVAWWTKILCRRGILQEQFERQFGPADFVQIPLRYVWSKEHALRKSRALIDFDYVCFTGAPQFVEAAAELKRYGPGPVWVAPIFREENGAIICRWCVVA